MDRTKVLRRAAWVLGLLGIMLVVVPASLIHEGPSRFVWVKVGFAMLAAAAVCAIPILRRSLSAAVAPPPSAYKVALAGLVIPPVAYGLHILQVAAVGISVLVMLAAF